MNLFLTGGTGSVGLELVRLALRRANYDEIRVLVRASSRPELEARWSRLVTLASDGRLGPKHCPRIRPVAGDITRVDLGLDEDSTRWLTTRATHVVHAAAAIDFNADRASVQPINVEGTRHLLDLAHRMERLAAVAHVSTLYVAGRRTGVVREDELEHEAGFVNPYEESKYDAELLARTAARAGLPLAVYRMSLLMGRESDGYVHHPLEAHKMLEFFLSGRAPRVPGGATHTLDMLPTDYAVRVLYELFFERFVPGATFQISSGTSAPTGADLLEACRRHLRRQDWTVDWMSAVEWGRLRESDHAHEHGVSPAAQWMFEVIGDYLLLPKRFCRAATDALLGTSKLPPPPVLDYLPTILDACAASNWGRR